MVVLRRGGVIKLIIGGDISKEGQLVVQNSLKGFHSGRFLAGCLLMFDLRGRATRFVPA